MPWYYAGPEAKPVGPVTLEELQARHAQGIVKPDTYVIEHTGQPPESLAWKKYRDVVPAAPNIPSVPPQTPPPVAPATAQPHPLFPSALPPGAQPSVFPHDLRPDPHRLKPTNTACAWGFALGLGGFFFSFACIGIFLALPSLLLCVIGLAQLNRNPQQQGKGLAVAGLALSGIGLIISLIFIIALAVPMLKAHSLTVTEQTSNDSE